jgi:ribonucleotide monophosphatase NagD (HAD superfamily)
MENKPRLAIDFDGTIYDGKEVLPGCIEALAELRKTYTISIYSARQTDHEREQMKSILDVNGVPYDDILGIKEEYVALIDDKAIRFDGNWATVHL